MKAQAVIRTALLTLLLILILGCVTLFLVLESWVGTKEEIGRVTSPDSALDAVIIRSNPGAMSSFGYWVYITPVGEEPKGKDEVFSASNVRDIEIMWRKPKFLEIRYRQAIVSHFTNLWARESAPRYWVEIRLIPEEGEADWSEGDY